MGWPGLTSWEPAFSQMGPRLSVVVKVKVVLCNLAVLFIHMFSQLVFQLWVNFHNAGKPKQRFQEHKMISKVPTLAAMTNTSNLANRCPMQDLEIVNFVNKKLFVNRI